jgi:hypothetical protein
MEQDVDKAIARLAAKGWDELEAVEHEERLLFPDVIHKARKGGKFDEVAVLLRVPRKDERRKARLEARKWAAEVGVDPKEDPGLFDDMDTVCILARSVREPKPPYDQHRTARNLEREYDARSLTRLWARLSAMEDAIDPRIDELLTDERVFWGAVMAVAQHRDIGPLADIVGDEQNSFVVRMAVLLVNSEMFRSWSQSLETSTAER